MDGGGVVVFDTYGDQADAQLINVVGDGSAKTVGVCWLSGGPVLFNGMKVFNGDHAKGIGVTSHATAPTRTQFWLDDATHWDKGKFFQPSLVSITDLRNDCASGVTSAQVKTNLAAIITKINTLYTPNPKPSSLSRLVAPADGWFASEAAVEDNSHPSNGGGLRRPLGQTGNAERVLLFSRMPGWLPCRWSGQKFLALT